MKPLVEKAEAAGVSARPIAFLTDAVAPDCADRQRPGMRAGAARLASSHSLAPHVIEALVRDVFARAACDVAVFVDPEGQGVPAAAGDRPILVTLAGGAHDGVSERLGTRLATTFQTGIRVFGYVGPRAPDAATADSRALRPRR